MRTKHKPRDERSKEGQTANPVRKRAPDWRENEGASRRESKTRSTAVTLKNTLLSPGQKKLHFRETCKQKKDCWMAATDSEKLKGTWRSSALKEWDFAISHVTIRPKSGIETPLKGT